MFPFHMLTLPKRNKKFQSYVPPTPGEIKDSLTKLKKCAHCHFVMFDNYWSNEIKEKKAIVCPTCGHRN